MICTCGADMFFNERGNYWQCDNIKHKNRIYVDEEQW